MVPVEIGIATYRTSKFYLEKNEERLRIDLDMLEEKRDGATLQAATYK